MLKRVGIMFCTVLIILSVYDSIPGYPVDGYLQTGIRRLARLQLIIEGKLNGTMPATGARKSIMDIKLNLNNSRGDSLTILPEINAALQKKIDAIFPNRDESYALALLDITPGKPVRFAKKMAGNNYVPGSVGKLAIAAGLFAELKNLFPDDVGKRQEMLRTRQVIADKWIIFDSHTIPFFDPETKQYVSRAAKEGDVFSLYEWTDHMLSASANSAASVVWKEVMLMRRFGKDYPPSFEQEREFFSKTPKMELRDIAVSTVNDPLRKIGISKEEWQLGSFFTKTGKSIVPGGGGSYANPQALLRYLIEMERGKLVDEWSSLEIKRLMYMTARRIRYASAPALEKAAVYFKSGSQYRCKEEPDFKCGKYMGNVENYMNSVAIVEQPDGRIYLVVLMSNVLKINSAVEHQTLATYIDRALAK